MDEVIGILEEKINELMTLIKAEERGRGDPFQDAYTQGVLAGFSEAKNIVMDHIRAASR
jgi:hypothetical protein